ncbi:hypothetical protein BB561_002894 [Smittium simulii]|uniref:Retrotransposon gag domain-containing protein n=1 Tax=Smittium simulii TaxID=133385 RepID=A0A2T9YNS0_9FUNG|nr:hypothetical protein BB561_002894 [Smittium simulii]
MDYANKMKSYKNPVLWIHKFEQIADIQGWADGKQTAYFKAYMIDTALEWIINIKTTDSKNFTFNKWKDTFLKKYRKEIRIAKRKDLLVLEELCPQEFNNLEQFNQEFIKRLNKIDNRYYTKNMIKTNYLKHTYSVNSSTTEKLLQDNDIDILSLDKIMKLFQAKADNKTEIRTLLTPTTKEIKTPKDQKDDDLKIMIE